MHIADKDQAKKNTADKNQSAQENTTTTNDTQILLYKQQQSMLKQQNNPTHILSELEKRIINEEQCINEQRKRELEDDDGTFHIHTSEKYDETAIHDEYKLIDTIQNNTKQLH